MGPRDTDKTRLGRSVSVRCSFVLFLFVSVVCPWFARGFVRGLSVICQWFVPGLSVVCP